MQFVLLCATLAVANCGFIAEQPAYSSLSYAAPVKTLVHQQPIAYAADHHVIAAAPSTSYTKTHSYSAPKSYISQPAASYHSYEPAHYSAPLAVSSYHHEPSHQLAYAAPAYGHYEHGTSEQNIVRSAHGTVSHISKAVDTPHSSVRKYDTRIINDGYKTLSYQPATTYVQSAPVLTKTVVAQPLLTKTVAHVAQPVAYSQPIAYAQPQYVHSEPQYAHAAPQYAHAAPQYAHAAPQYAHAAPVLAKSVHFSPAADVAHVSFDGFGTHYGW